MKAMVYEKYGPPDVLQLREVAKPVPKDSEVLIRVCATTTMPSDCLARRGESMLGRFILGLRKPRKQILGTELAGEIEAVGVDVTRFKQGDQVYAFTGFGLGAYAEYDYVEAGHKKGNVVIRVARNPGASDLQKL